MKFKNNRRALAAACLVAGLGVSPLAGATNGYFPHGYGIKAKGMGGASTAMADDALGGATNPAKMVFVGSRLDLGLELFSPHRDAERSAVGFGGLLEGKVSSDKTVFWVPEVGYNRMLNPNLSVGVTVYGNGGMNTTYPQGPFQCTPDGGVTIVPGNALCGGGSLGVDLSQLVVAPTVAWKAAPQHALGASLLLGYQMFKAFGVQAFDNAQQSSAPGSVTNNGYDSSTGVGLRIGYMGQIGSNLSVGAAWSSKVNMGKLDKYKGLFAGGGDFDIPSNWSLGVAFKPAADLTLALDYQRINYSGVASVSNSSQIQQQLGSPGGPGFGWQDVDVVKLGLAWQMNPQWTLRAGYNRGDNPVRARDVTFNILAPGVMKSHYTAGFTWAMGPSSELSGALMVAPRQTVTGASILAGTETIGMKQYSVGLGWSMKF
ncbi:long-chain fatty acid transport protein [Burkholderiales bacterium JOSHI_001]|nr:long-chain fatty acid transport protein [Burkholderiales bacterium JOSHI_001]